MPPQEMEWAVATQRNQLNISIAAKNICNAAGKHWSTVELVDLHWSIINIYGKDGRKGGKSKLLREVHAGLKMIIGKSRKIGI